MNIDRVVLAMQLALIAAAMGLLFIINRRLLRQPASIPSGRVRSRLARAAEVELVALWFGLAAGALHVSLALITRYARHRFLMAGPQMFWMTPLANAAIFASLGLLPAFLAAIQRRIEVRQIAVPFFAGFAAFSLMLPFPQLHKLAALALAAGIAMQVSRVMTPRLDSWLLLMKRTTGAALAVLGAVAVGMQLWDAASERHRTSLVPQARAGAPNVLIVVMDTVRAEELSLYGYGRPTTPNLERWAREGVTFDTAFSTAPWTLKAHGTLFSGLYPQEFEGNFERVINFRTPVLAEVFRDRGYMTGGFVANLLYTSWESGLERGFVHYDDYRLSWRQFLLHSWIPHVELIVNLAHSRSLRDMWDAIVHPALALDTSEMNARTYEQRTAGQINDAFLNWQAEHSGRPFFAFLNYFDAHYPYRSPGRFEKQFRLPGSVNKGLYDGAIAYIDSELDRLLSELRRRSLLDNTIVMITSDHGEQFDEHGLRQHANSLYTQALRVPLIVRYPSGVPADVRIAPPATLRDVPATISQLAGLPDSTFPGESLSVNWSPQGARATSSPVFARLGPGIRTPFNASRPIQAIFDARYQYIRAADGDEELFAYRADPRELADLSRTEAGRRKILELRPRLAKTTALFRPWGEVLEATASFRRSP